MDPSKSPFRPNPGKKLSIIVNDQKFTRFTLQTQLVQKGDNIPFIVSKYLKNFYQKLKSKKLYTTHKDEEWYVVISEKIVAIAQGRSFLIENIKPGFWANWLSQKVMKTPAGIGLGSPWTMQIAIDSAGLPRILFAAGIAAITKPLGLKGMFYHVAGREVSCIDGPTEYSLYPSNVSAKLGPKDPQKVAKLVHVELQKRLLKGQLKNFIGVIIIDSNDLGRLVLGNTTGIKNAIIADSFADNPFGQGREQTPLAVVYIAS